jgi:methionyl-tRNA formyltransferase
LGLGIRAAARAADPTATPFQPGEVVVTDRQQAIIATGEGGLSLVTVQPAGKRVMPIADFLHGYPLREGQRLG